MTASKRHKVGTGLSSSSNSLYVVVIKLTSCRGFSPCSQRAIRIRCSSSGRNLQALAKSDAAPAVSPTESEPSSACEQPAATGGAAGLHVGCSVVVTGLQARPDLNGCRCKAADEGGSVSCVTVLQLSPYVHITRAFVLMRFTAVSSAALWIPTNKCTTYTPCLACHCRA